MAVGKVNILLVVLNLGIPNNNQNLRLRLGRGKLGPFGGRYGG